MGARAVAGGDVAVAELEKELVQEVVVLPPVPLVVVVAGLRRVLRLRRGVTVAATAEAWVGAGVVVGVVRVVLVVRRRLLLRDILLLRRHHHAVVRGLRCWHPPRQLLLLGWRRLSPG